MVQTLMKPLVYFDFKELNNGEVAINKNRLQEILEEVYQTGYTDGTNCRPYITTTPWNTRDNTVYCNNATLPSGENYTSGDSIPRPNITVTCKNTENS